MSYEQRCEACRYSQYHDIYAGKWSLWCVKIKTRTERDNQCDKFEREPGADDVRSGDDDNTRR